MVAVPTQGLEVAEVVGLAPSIQGYPVVYLQELAKLRYNSLKKATDTLQRGMSVSMVAGAGFEPATFGL